MVKSNLRPNIYKKGQWIHNKRQQMYDVQFVVKDRGMTWALA